MSAVIIAMGCQDTMKLPVDQGSITGSGDTVFIKLNPVWDAAFGVDLSQPADVIIGPDGLVYIADMGNDRIVVLNRSGEQQDFGNLNTLNDIDHPTGICFDQALNLYICGNGETVYIWSRYLNDSGVEAVAAGFLLSDTISGDTMTVTEAEDMIEYTYGQPDSGRYWVVIDVAWDSSTLAVEEALFVREFYTSPTSQFYAAAVDPVEGNVVYLTDPAKQRIYRVRSVIDKMVMCGNGTYSFTYQAEPLGVAISYGSGIMTCDQPRGITFDPQGYMLFAQTGGNFQVQKITQDNFAAFNIYGFADNSDIMIENRFANPCDVCIGGGVGGGVGWIYAADTDSNRIQVFDTEGNFLMNAGFTPLPMDTVLVDTVITQIDSVTFDTSYVYTDTTLILEINDELALPAGAAAFDGVLYIADTENDRIIRYGLSSSTGDLPGIGF